MEQIEYLENENLSMQKELVKTLEKKRVVLGDLEKENINFTHKFQVKVNEKESLREQISEIENLVRLLRHEIDQTNIDTKRINITIEKEDELLNKKQAEEKRVVKLVCDDIKEQIRNLEEQFHFAQNTQNKQEAIEKHLKLSFEKAQRELEKML